MVLWRKGGNHSAKSYTIFVCPGEENKFVSDFFGKDGKPIQFCVEFIYGKTEELPENLGQYLLDQGLAQETRFILEN